MVELRPVIFSNNTATEVCFYKQNKDTSKINIFIKPKCTITSTKDLDNRIFCTMEGHRGKKVKDGTVEFYNFKVGCLLASPFLFLNPIISLHSFLAWIAHQEKAT